jgi:hypothetical protein
MLIYYFQIVTLPDYLKVIIDIKMEKFAAINAAVIISA